MTGRQISIIIIIDNDNIIKNKNSREKTIIEKADLIIHPARLALLDALAGGPKTTQELDLAVPGVPKSSIYRHLKLLLEGGMIEVAETHSVKGIEERVYRLAQPPHLSQADMAGFTLQDHRRYFNMFLSSLLQGFSDYIAANPDSDLLQDRVGYSETSFFASQAEIDEFATTLQRALLKLASNRPGSGRRRHRIAIISHPVTGQGDNNG